MNIKPLNKALLKQAVHLIDHWLDFQTYVKEVPGVAVGIFSDDELIFQKEYGYANLEAKTRLTDQHLFRIASHSKLFTATAILQLYHAEKLSLDDRVAKYLPWFDSENDGNLRHVTIRHLLTHSSGITRDGKTAHWERCEFPELDSIIEQTRQGISVYGTSEVFKYSNFGYTLLGQVLETVSGQSFHDYVQENILTPLGMTNTVTDVNDENIERHATGYTRKYPGKPRKPFEHIPAQVMHAATGLSSTVGDLITFYQAHRLGNDGLLPDYIKREMQRVQFQGNGDDFRGLGFRLADFSGMRSTGHSGGYQGFITQSGIFQKEQLIIVVLTNALSDYATKLYGGIAKLLAQLNSKQESFDRSSEKPRPDFSDLLGYYESSWGISLFSQIGARLVAIPPEEHDLTECLDIYDTIEQRTFAAPENSFSSPGENITFEGDDADAMVFVDSHGAKHQRFILDY